MKTLNSLIIVSALSLWSDGAIAGERNGSVDRTSSTTSSLGQDARPLRQAPKGKDVVDLSSPVLDFKQKGEVFRYTLTTNTVWVFNHHVAGRQIWLQVAQDATGGWTNTWPAGLLWPSGGRFNGSTSPNRFDMIQIVDDGEHWLAVAKVANFCATDCSEALQFDGAQNFAMTSNNAAFCSTTLTIECWIKTTASDGTILSTNNRTTRQGWQFAMLGSSSIWWGGDIGSPYSDGISYMQMQGTTSINDGQWHHVAVTISTSGGTASGTLWIDGASNATTTHSTQAVANNRPLFMGTWWETQGDNAWPGILDEVRISSVVRYSSTFTPAHSFTVDSATIGYWKFNEGDGTTAYDAAGNHDATLQGSPAPTWVDGN